MNILDALMKDDDLPPTYRGEIFIEEIVNDLKRIGIHPTDSSIVRWIRHYGRA